MRRRGGRADPIGRREWWVWGALVALAVVARFADLGSRPYQFDEGQVAYAAYLLSEHGDYHYMPVLHGPLNYELTALSHLVFGTADVANRIPAALAGSILVALAFALRRPLGRGGALAAGVLLCFSPTLLYYSRFSREELVMAAVTLAIVAVAARLVASPRRWHVEALGALLALSFATKEATFLHVPIGIVAGCAWWRLRGPARLRSRGGEDVATNGDHSGSKRKSGLRFEPLAVVRHVPRAWLLSGAAVFALVFVILFGQFGTHLSGVQDGAYGGLRYWAHEHGLHRGGEDWFAYLILLVAYELPLLVLGTIGAVWSLRRRHALGTGMTVAAVLTLAIYSYAGERFAWLLVTTLLPVALLGGLGFAALWRSSRLAAVAVTAPLLAVLAWSDVQVQILHPNDPDELMTVAPTDAAVPQIAAQLRRRDAQARAAGRPRPTIEVDPNYGSASPWSWYLRGLLGGYPDMAADTYVPSGDVLVVTDASRDLLGSRLRGYEGRPFVLRGRRPPMGTGFTPAGLARWFVHRTPWAPVTAEREWLYERRPARAPANEMRGDGDARRSSR
jgi:uncharacterized protein (TIGR03663 family)